MSQHSHGLGTVLLVGIAAGGTGCGIIHQVKSEPPPPVTVPEAFGGADKAEGTALGKWWTGFSDPELDVLVESAFADNLNLEAAYARLSAADAAARIAFSPYVPSANISAQISQAERVVNFGMGAQGFEQASVTLQGSLSYELDLWGRLDGQTRAGVADRAATRNDLATMYVTVSSGVVDTWLQGIEQKATLDLLGAQLEVNKTYLELVELRFRQGLASSLDVFQQRQQTASIEAAIPPARAQLAVLEHQLAVLLGKAPGTVRIERAQLPGLPAQPDVGVPSALLQERPDVRSAQMRVVAADHRLGSAIANRFPRITLSASAGFTGFDVVTGLFENFFYNLIAGLVQPLTDQVRLEAEERRARAQLKEQVANYGTTVLTALREVEDALVREARQDELLAELNKQVDLARSTLTEARTRYQNGLSDYLPVLNALQTLQTAEQRRVGAERLRLSFRVQLCRALGGQWATTEIAEKEAS